MSSLIVIKNWIRNVLLCFLGNSLRLYWFLQWRLEIKITQDQNMKNIDQKIHNSVQDKNAKISYHCLPYQICSLFLHILEASHEQSLWSSIGKTSYSCGNQQHYIIHLWLSVICGEFCDFFSVVLSVIFLTSLQLVLNAYELSCNWCDLNNENSCKSTFLSWPKDNNASKIILNYN